MPSNLYGPNVIEVNGAAMLLTTTGGGAAVHLTAAADGPDSGRGAVLDFNVDSDRDGRAGTLDGHDRAALTEPRWTGTTLCGRAWAIMVGGDGGAIGRFGEVAFVPTCRRCLAILDRQFPRPRPDDRLTLVAQLAADAVIDQRGFAEIHDVPGDQLDELRKTVRALIRKRTVHPVRTHVINGVVYVECTAVHHQRRDDGMREAAEAIDALLKGDRVPRRDRDWVISWSTWGVT